MKLDPRIMQMVKEETHLDAAEAEEVIEALMELRVLGKSLKDLRCALAVYEDLDPEKAWPRYVEIASWDACREATKRFQEDPCQSLVTAISSPHRLRLTESGHLDEKYGTDPMPRYRSNARYWAYCHNLIAPRWVREKSKK